MQKFKDRWEIQSNWQLFFPVLGLILLILSSFLVGKYFLTAIEIHSNTMKMYWVILLVLTLAITVLLLQLTLKIFTVLEKKWSVTYRWELIAIFIAFAITGSTAARVSDPILSFMGLQKENISAWLYWPIRIFLIFPLYQILLLLVGWLLGQFQFFWNFQKKMFSRHKTSRQTKN